MSTISPEQVIQFLEQNPDLLVRNPQLLSTLEVPHGSGTASLIERQVEQLRTENRKLGQKLSHLAGIAGENERLMHRLHRMALELMAAESAHAMLTALAEGLQQEFDAASVRLLLHSREAAQFDHAAVAPLPEPAPEWLHRILADQQACCGRLTQEKRAVLFADPEIGSVALIPLDASRLLAIGAVSDERFHPDMGTLFLDLLGQTLKFRLERENGHKGVARQAQA